MDFITSPFFKVEFWANLTNAAHSERKEGIKKKIIRLVGGNRGHAKGKSANIAGKGAHVAGKGSLVTCDRGRDIQKPGLETDTGDGSVLVPTGHQFCF